MIDRPTFSTPEAAALAGWTHSPAARARAVEVRPHPDGDDVVWVVVQLGEQTGFHDQDIVSCQRQADGTWVDVGSTGTSSA